MTETRSATRNEGALWKYFYAASRGSSFFDNSNDIIMTLLFIPWWFLSSMNLFQQAKVAYQV